MPHNYHIDFNSQINQEKLAYYDMMGRLWKNTYMWFYKYSGLKAFFNTRVFKRGIENGDLRADITIPPKVLLEKARGISKDTPNPSI